MINLCTLYKKKNILHFGHEQLRRHISQVQCNYITHLLFCTAEISVPQPVCSNEIKSFKYTLALRDFSNYYKKSMIGVL